MYAKKLDICQEHRYNIYLCNLWVNTMSSQVKYTNKTTGVTYVYESTSYWDKEKKQPRNKRVYIGKINPATGQLEQSKKCTPNANDIRDMVATARVVGPIQVLDMLDKTWNISKLLKIVCPTYYREIQIMAYYLMINGGALSHCETWCYSYFPELSNQLSSQRITEILQSINLDARQGFLKNWISTMSSDDYYCYDITSISSYSQSNEYIKYGYNRDKERLPQLNLAAVFSQKSGLPVHYHALAGNITDVTTLDNFLSTLKMLDTKRFHYVMDRGFYSKKNVDALISKRAKFVLAVPTNNKWVQSAIDDVYDDVENPDNYHRIGQDTVYVNTRLHSWGEQKARCYLHLYYNPYLRACDTDKFNAKLLEYKAELESDNLICAHQEAYDTFFIAKTTPKRGKKVSYNKPAISKYIKRYTGFYAILTNSIKDPVESLYVYRNRDVVEKCFDDLKNQLDMKRLRMHSSQTVEARLFVQFIALIYTSALRQLIKSTELSKKYTVHELLYELSNITKVTYSGKNGAIITQISKSQREILKTLQITIV